MISKRQQIKTFLNKKDYMRAMNIARKFSPNRNDKNDVYLLDNIKCGYDAYLYPHFYKQLKKNPEELIQRGIKCLIKLIG